MSYVGGWLEIVCLPFVSVGVRLFAVHDIFHDDMMGRCKTYYRAETTVRSMEEVRYPDEQRFRVSRHMLAVGIQQLIAEKAILGRPWESLDHELGVLGREKGLKLIALILIVEGLGILMSAYRA